MVETPTHMVDEVLPPSWPQMNPFSPSA